MLQPDVEEAFQQIDAAMFSGDSFIHEEGRKKLREYLERWNKFDTTYTYYAQDGTLMTAKGERSIFDDVDDSYCPNCKQLLDKHHRDAGMLAPDAYWYVCPDCGFKTDPE